jgi:lipoic acid synthetase
MRRSGTLFGAMLVRRGEADAMLCGTYGRHASHLRYVRNVIGLRPDAKTLAAMNVVMLPNHTVFICDTYVNADPRPEQIAEMTLLAAEEVRRFGRVPKVALLSHSNFGSSNHWSARKMRKALALLHERAPGLEVEGEMHGDAALVAEIWAKMFPRSRLRERRHDNSRAAGGRSRMVSGFHRLPEWSTTMAEIDSATQKPHPVDPRGASIPLRGADKTARIPIKVVSEPPLKKPAWIRVRASRSEAFYRVKEALRGHSLHTVCEEASCPNINECFGKGTATFMILGALCTRRCPFCDVAHGRPLPPDEAEPQNLAEVVAAMRLNYVVITSVDRDDLRDGGAGHFARCIQAVRQCSPGTRIEVLVPDFRGRLEVALDALAASLPDVMNHNLETVPRLYKAVRPGADYTHSLKLLQAFKARWPHIPTKSGLMLGVGETDAEILEVIHDLRAHGVTMLTVGQYLQPGPYHLPVKRFVEPAAFAEFERAARDMGFVHAACGPLVRSSYHADEQAQCAGVGAGLGSAS